MKAHRVAVAALFTAYVAWSVLIRRAPKRGALRGGKPRSLEREFRELMRA